MIFKTIFTLLLIIHGIAHLVGFVVPWKILTLAEMPYKSTIFYNKIDLGHSGIKIIGIFWLLIALLFFIAALFFILQYQVWFVLSIISICSSFVLCILGLPESKIGVFANFFILLLLFAIQWFDWIILD
jgi:hypothetical protein